LESKSIDAQMLGENRVNLGASAASADPATAVDPRAWELISSLLFDTRGQVNCYDVYRDLHAIGDDFLTPNGTHIVIGYSALANMMRDPKFLKNNAHGASQKTQPFSPLTPQQMAELERWDADSAPLLGSLDAPDHMRIRSLVQRNFLPHIVAKIRDKIALEIDVLLSGIDPTQPVDITSQFGAIFAPDIMAELIGLPAEDRAYVSKLTGVFMQGIDPASPFELRLASAKAAHEQRKYVRKVIAARRAEPRDDLVSALVQNASGVLAEPELVQLLTILYLGGYETTAHMIGNGLVALLTNPDQLALLLSDLDGLMRQAVEEMLRFDGPISLTQVFPVEGATLMGRRADVNMPYVGLLTAANHDPDAFEEPNRFLIKRQNKPIQTFGGGPHFCLGMNLARLELQMVFQALLSRFPKMQLLELPPPRVKTFQQQSYTRVPVLLSPPGSIDKRLQA
jgi:cytochrome P450